MRILLAVSIILLASCSASKPLRLADYKKDILLETTRGNITIRLSDETPLLRDNYLKLVKNNYFTGILFHRVIQEFMIQAGDPDSKNAAPGMPLGNGGPGYTIPFEYSPNLFHKKGVIGAARKGEDVNPSKANSGSQFYLVQGKVWTDAQIDSLETARLEGKKIPPEHRAIYKTLGGTPHLDYRYSVFGEVISGIEVVDDIAGVATSKGPDKDRPLQDVIIKKARLIKRK